VTNIHKVLNRGVYLRGEFEDKYPFTRRCHYLNQTRECCLLEEFTPAKEFITAIPTIK
jgi:hypothetical protein